MVVYAFITIHFKSVLIKEFSFSSVLGAQGGEVEGGEGYWQC